jgi:hypothetical protein
MKNKLGDITNILLAPRQTQQDKGIGTQCINNYIINEYYFAMLFAEE